MASRGTASARLVAKFLASDGSKDAVVALAQYVILQGSDAPAVAASCLAWMSAVEQAPASRLVPLLYVANELAVRSAAFVGELAKYLPAAFTLTAKRTKNTAQLVRLSTIWQERALYSARFMQRLRDAATAAAGVSSGGAQPAGTLASALPAPTQPSNGGAASAPADADGSTTPPPPAVLLESLAVTPASAAPPPLTVPLLVSGVSAEGPVRPQQSEAEAAADASVAAALAEAQRRHVLTAAVRRALGAVRADLLSGTLDVDALAAGAAVRVALADAAAAEPVARLALAVARLNAARAPALVERLQAEAAEQEMLLLAAPGEEDGGDLGRLEATLRGLVAAAAEGKTVRVRRGARLDDSTAALYSSAAAAAARRPPGLGRSRSGGSASGAGGATPPALSSTSAGDREGFRVGGGAGAGTTDDDLDVDEFGLDVSGPLGSPSGPSPVSGGGLASHASVSSGGRLQREAFDDIGLGGARGDDGDDAADGDDDYDPLMADDLLDLGLLRATSSGSGAPLPGGAIAASAAAAAAASAGPSAGSKRPREEYGDAGRGSSRGAATAAVSFSFDSSAFVWDHLSGSYVVAPPPGDDGDGAPPDTSESWRDH